MRGRSLVGPLLLIGIGVLFLARNVVPDLPLLDYLAQYWPFLLILWGALRLVEIASWAMRGQALPAYGVSGGEWMLVVFLCMFGLSLHSVRGFTSWFPVGWIDGGGLEVFGESYDYPVNADVPANGAKRVVVEGIRGKIRIVGADPAAVKVTGRQTIRAVDQATADRARTESDIQVRQEGEQLVIGPANLPPDPLTTSRDPETKGRRLIYRTRRITADLDVTIPRGAVLIVRGRDTDVDASGLTGTVDVNGDNTSVRLENIGGEVRLDVSGSSVIRAVNLKGAFELKGRGNDIDLENIAGQVTVSGSWSGLVQMRQLAKPVRWNGLQTTMSFQALPGDLRMTIGDISASRIMGPLRIDSQNKDIDLVDTTGSTNITLQRGDVRVSALGVPVSEMTIRLQSGSIDVSLPERARFNLDAVTERGEARNDYGSEVQESKDGRRGQSLKSSQGGPMVELRLSRGDITVRSGAPVAQAPVPPMPRVPDPPRAPAASRLRELPQVAPPVSQ
jgi:hypothetical protein